eukprot:scaffold325749_cov15-Prasinocladus_malaysianus.AAC.1
MSKETKNRVVDEKQEPASPAGLSLRPFIFLSHRPSDCIISARVRTQIGPRTDDGLMANNLSCGEKDAKQDRPQSSLHKICKTKKLTDEKK